MRMKSCSFGLLFGSILSAAASAQTLNVPSVLYPTIQVAINAAQPGNTVLVAPGTYSGPVNFLGKTITVRGSGGAAATILQGSGGSRVVTFTTGETSAATLDGFTVTGGNGGVLIQNASPTIINCRINGNYATTEGGGLRCLATGTGNASPSILASTVSMNLSQGSGGGMYFAVDTTATSLPVISGCTVDGNFGGNLVSAQFNGGGGLCFSGGSPTIFDSSISGNQGFENGGGILLRQAGSVQLTKCRIVGNTVLSGSNYYSSVGGGIGGAATQWSLVGCLIVGNTAISAGGGVSISIAGTNTVTLRNCTLSGNRAGAYGGFALMYYSGSGAPPAVDIASSILYGNLGLDLFISGMVAATNHSDVGTGTVGTGTGNLSLDPLFVDAASSDYHLASSSPCRNAGSPNAAGLPATDLDGSPRVASGVVDIGCDEIPAAALPGTNEDLDLYAWVDAAGDPLASTRTAQPAQTIRLQFRSPGGTFAGAAPFLAAQVYTTALPIGGTPGFPAVQLNLGLPYATLYGALQAQSFPAAGLPSAGVDLEALVPPGLSGRTLRVQGAVITPIAANGLFATTSAREVVFP